MNKLELEKTANEIRKGIVTAVHSAKSGHPGGSLSAADIFTYLYFEEMNIDPANPKKADRDRFVLLKGTCGAGTLRDFSPSRIFSGGRFGNAPPCGLLSSGASGHEAHSGCGHVERFLGTGRFCGSGNGAVRELSNESYRVYTLAGDGEIQEGQIWEAAMFAGHRKLDNLVVIVDNNGLQIDGKY